MSAGMILFLADVSSRGDVHRRPELIEIERGFTYRSTSRVTKAVDLTIILARKGERALCYFLPAF